MLAQIQGIFCLIFSIFNSLQLNYSKMKQEDFDKMDNYIKASQKKIEVNEYEFPHNQEANLSVLSKPNDAIKQNTVLSTANGFKALKEQKNRKYKNQTRTKWDSFQPYAFSKLSDGQRVEHFLQLFDDYLQIKIKMNEQSQKYKKAFSKVTFLQGEMARLKANSPHKEGGKQKNQRVKQQVNQNQQLKEEVRRLHEKIISLTGNKAKITPARNRPQSAVKGQKMIFPANQNIKAELELERKQVRQLLLIIDELKATKFSFEAQLKQKQAKEGASRVFHPHAGKVNTESQFHTYAYDLQKWKEKYNDMELCFNKMSEDKDRRIKQLQIQNLSLKENERAKVSAVNFGKINQINSIHLQEKIADLQREKESMQRELRRMVALPFNQTGNNKNHLELQTKCSQLQLALQKMKDELTKTKELNSKYLAELQYKTKEGTILKGQNQKIKKQLKQLLQRQVSPKRQTTEIDYDDYYRKLLGIVRLQGDDPVWRKFSNIAAPTFSNMTETQVKKAAQQLWLSKLQLLAHLEKAQIELRTVRESTESRIGLYLKDKDHLQEELRLARARLDQWVSMEQVNVNRDVQLFEWKGIRYDDSISVFQAEEQELKQLQNQQNYFDLYLGQLNLDQTALLRNPQNKIKQITQMVSFFTIDFYNHDTQHSHFVQGNAKKLSNNFTFKVQMNQPFIKFLSKQSVMLELWSPQGSSTVLLGKGEIWLKDLVSKAIKDISAVIKGKCPFYNQIDRSLVATLQYRIRMRLPIGSYCDWKIEDSKVNKVSDMFRLGQRKRLQIKITKAANLPSSSSHFIYFSLQGEDFYTEAVRGTAPEWNYRKQIDLLMNEQLQTQLKQKYLQFILFDDEKPINEDQIGIAKADLTRLIDSVQHLDLDLELRDTNFELVGRVKVQFKWI